jgi:hypothetical protein
MSNICTVFDFLERENGFVEPFIRGKVSKKICIATFHGLVERYTV